MKGLVYLAIPAAIGVGAVLLFQKSGEAPAPAVPVVQSQPQGHEPGPIPPNPEAEAAIPRLSAAELFAMTQTAAPPVIVDVRMPSAYHSGHLPGAVNVPLIDFQAKWRTLPKDRLIALYCT